MRTLLITGGTSEIGQTIIRDQAARFDRIIAHCSSRPERLNTLREELGDKITAVCANFSDTESTQNMVAWLKAENMMPTDIVHLPAGSFELKNFPKVKWEQFERDMNIAMRSLVLILQGVLPEMARQHSGRIVVMLSSVTEGVPPKYLASYVTTKYALLGLVRELSAEYAEKGISINGVSPEMTETKYLDKIPPMVKELNRESGPRKRLLTPADILPAVRLLLSEDAGAITGQNLVITDGK